MIVLYISIADTTNVRHDIIISGAPGPQLIITPVIFSSSMTVRVLERAAKTMANAINDRDIIA